MPAGPGRRRCGGGQRGSSGQGPASVQRWSSRCLRAGEAGVAHGLRQRDAGPQVGRDGLLARPRAGRVEHLVGAVAGDDGGAGLVGDDDVAVVDRERRRSVTGRPAAGGRGRSREWPARRSGRRARVPRPRPGRRRRLGRPGRTPAAPTLRIPPHDETSVRPSLATTMTSSGPALAITPVRIWAPRAPRSAARARRSPRTRSPLVGPTSAAAHPGPEGARRRPERPTRWPPQAP